MRDNRFSDLLISLRVRGGYDRREFADLIGKDYITVSKWELGSAVPKRSELLEIAEKMSVSPEIFGICEAKPQSDGLAEAKEKLAATEEYKNAEYERAYKEKRERFAKYVKTSSYSRAGVKTKRIFAFVFDSFILGLLMLALALGAVAIIISTVDTVYAMTRALIVVIVAIALPILLAFAFRDFVFGGRSLGKRVFGLLVIDARTTEKAAVHQRLLRTLFNPGFIDVIFLLVRGKTIGDSIASTLVVSKKAYEAPVEPGVSREGYDSYDIPEKRTKNRTALTVIFVVIITVLMVFSFVSSIILTDAALESEKSRERYDVAYTYLTESDAFLKSGDEVSEIKLLSHSQSYSEIHDEMECIYVFATDSQTYVIVMHLEAKSDWYVCDICTKFY